MTAQPLSVGDLLDRVGLKPFQVMIFVLCALMALLDGLDTQSIGIVAPLVGKALKLTANQLGLIFSISQLGAAVGAMTIGPMGDRFGRRPMILLTGVLITVFTYLSATAASFYPLLIVRTAAGLGLGAALPLVMALASDYAPAKLRGRVVTMIFAAYPLGGAVGGVLNGWILGHFDWRAVFYFGAASPALVTILALLLLPESIQYLLLRGHADRVSALLHRIDPSADAAALTVGRTGAKPARVPVSQLFAAGLGPATVMLWGLYFFAYATLKVMTTWFPSILTKAGFDASAGGYALGAFNLGATFGMASAGFLTDRFGAFRALTPALVGGAVSVFLLGMYPGDFTAVVVLATLVGVFIGIGGSGANAIAVRLYSADVRATGLGLGVASSRYGQVASPMIVALMLTAGLGSGAVYAAVAALPLIAGLFVLGLMLREKAQAGAA